jgi:dihydroflavonol-4-reductase
MQAFVTGATGFIGCHVARVLNERGNTVRVLVRKQSNRDNIKSLNCEIVTGDLQDTESIFAAMDGCDMVFHVAADYRLWAKDPSELYKSNVEGTRNILEAARALKVQKVVYTSSVGALGIPKDGSSGNEDTPVTLEDMIGHYKRSKYLAEREAERFYHEYRLPVVIVNPSTPIGENDIKPTPTGKIIVDFLNRKLPAYVDTGLNLVDVRDVAQGHILAAEKGKPGRKYILGSQNITFRGILDMLAEITGYPAPKVRIPHAIVIALASVDTYIWDSLLHREPHIPLEGAKMARKHMYFDASRAINELGLPQTPVREALSRAVSWFCENGYSSAPAKLKR